MADLRFDAAANAIYHFVWDTFCDWYLELIKGQIDDETHAVAGWVLDQILVMLHPFMPFVTEELWHAQGDAALRADRREVARAAGARSMPRPRREVEWLIALTRRSAHAPRTSSASRRAPSSKPSCAEPSRHRARGDRAATPPRSSGSPAYRRSASSPRPAGAAMQIARGRDAFVIPLEGVIDIAAEKARLAKALASLAQGSATSLARPPRQPRVRREGQARGGRKGPRRPRAPRRRGRAARGGAGAAGVSTAAPRGQCRLGFRSPRCTSGMMR